jgi:hypothetical protein
MLENTLENLMQEQKDGHGLSRKLHARGLVLLGVITESKDKCGVLNLADGLEWQNASAKAIRFLPIGIRAHITRAPERFFYVSSSIVRPRKYCEYQDGIKEVPFNFY